MNRDYILRMIEQFVQGLVDIIKTRLLGNYEEALFQIQNASQRYLETDISVFLEKSPEQLLEYFNVGTKDFDAERCIICADLIYELAMICDAKQDEAASKHLKMLCLSLYLNAIPYDRYFQTQAYIKKTKGLMLALEGRVPMLQESLIAFQQVEMNLS